jgi:sulfate adenylyltransferase small subunit
MPAARRRRQLLDVAVEVFAVGGFHRTSMDDLAEAAGVTKPVLYQHFRSKRELYLELLEDVGGQMMAAVAKAVASARNPHQQVEAGFGAYFRFVEAHESAFKLLFGGGARRDEERSRAKERIFSFRDDFGQWNPRAQRPELWSLYNARVRKGEHVRVFPISNWTELDVWQYVAREQLELPPIYFAHEREVFRRDGMLYAASEYVERMDGEEPFVTSVRFRTVGDMTCTGGVESQASTIETVVEEIAATRVTERGETRADDRFSEAAMEDRKRVGYF